MPQLPLPVGGSALTGGDVPVSDGTDVLAEFSDVHRMPAAAPVRDALVEAFAQTHIAYQDALARAAALCDPTLSTGDELLLYAEERGVTPGTGESESSLKTRMFRGSAIVTPQAIVDAVNAILAPYTTKECQLVELNLDGWFVHDGGAYEWDSFIGVTPRYPDRLYVDDAAENDGFFLENNDPGGALVAPAGLVRNFHLRLPVLDGIDEDFAFAIDSDAQGTLPALGMFIPTGADVAGSESDGSVVTFVFDSKLTSSDIYANIVGVVESIKGQGISWSAYADPSL